MIMNTICIMCPMGCPITIEEINGTVEVKGCTCKRGKDYGVQEYTAPKRVVTSLVEADNGKVVPVKTAGVIDKKLIFEVLESIKQVKAQTPVTIGDTIIANVCGSGVDIVATACVD